MEHSILFCFTCSQLQHLSLETRIHSRRIDCRQEHEEVIHHFKRLNYSLNSLLKKVQKAHRTASFLYQKLSASQLSCLLPGNLNHPLNSLIMEQKSRALSKKCQCFWLVPSLCFSLSLFWYECPFSFWASQTSLWIRNPPHLLSCINPHHSIHHRNIKSNDFVHQAKVPILRILECPRNPDFHKTGHV